MMAVFFRRTNARIDRLLGVGSVFAAAMALIDGFVIGAIFLALAGIALYRLTSAENSPLFAFGARMLFAALLFMAGVFIIGA